MLQLNRGAMFILAIVLVERAALADPAYYFHKPAVDRSSYEREFGDCLELAAGASVKRVHAYTPNPYAAAVGSFLGGIMASRERRSIVLGIMRTCMADKGYERIIAPRDVASKLASLNDEEKAARLFELATAQTPLGEALPK